MWVAAGRYLPTQGIVISNPRAATFSLPDNAEVYGGFRGDELSLDDRAGLFDETILSGDVGVPGDPSDNCYNVVHAMSDTPTYAFFRLDGFTITAGAGIAGRRGGGLRQTAQLGPQSWSLLDLHNCRITDNHSDLGGGIAIDNFCRLRMSRCTIAGNSASWRGGGLHCVSGWVWSYNSVWSDNSALGAGGAIFTQSNANDSMRFVNNLLHDNHAREGGAAFIGGTWFTHGIGKFVNCTVAFNSAGRGGGFAAANSGSLKVRNSIVWGNRSILDRQIWAPGSAVQVEYSNVQGGFTGPGNLGLEPLFLDAGLRNLRTHAGSPVHDAGSLGLVALDGLDLDGDGITDEPVPFDLDGGRRQVDDPLAPNTGPGLPPVDMGAFEAH